MDLREPPPVVARLRRVLDLAFAAAAGLGMTLVAYAVMVRTPPATIADYFLESAYLEGGGRNVVNVILVDFRAFDTLGEITVLAIVALSVFALLRRFRPARESVDAPAQQRLQAAFEATRNGGAPAPAVADYLRIPGLVIQLMAPVIALFGIHLFLRGHDLPGGGFAAGITVSVALILLYMARGARWVEARLRVAPLRWIGLGLLLAVATGLGSMLLGYPFLTSHSRHVMLPLLGELPLASAMAFDLGVFGVVVGATSLMLVALAHQSLRRPRVPAEPDAGEAP
jgi:multicomponent K+:H+ antiporter subunit A